MAAYVYDLECFDSIFTGIFISAEIRAKQIHNAAKYQKTRDYTVIAVTETKEGYRIISSSEPTLRTEQILSLKQGEIPAAVSGENVCAEVRGIIYAKRHGFTPIGTAASRPICPECAAFMREHGVEALSPLR